MLKAVEFFSGIGAFAQAAQRFDIEIAGAFDQNDKANEVYQLNFGRAPSPRNLDTIALEDIPKADMWWLSPPCTPFSRRGKQRDADDPRARSFLHLIEQMRRIRPSLIGIENVLGFTGSDVHQRLLQALQDKGYHVCEFDLCSTALGIPMRRPRHFVLASLSPLAAPTLPRHDLDPPLRFYLVENLNLSQLIADEAEVERYGASYDVVDPICDDAIAICFTSGYGKSQKVSGSLLKCQSDATRLRRFAPDEILRLLGFPPSYRLPAGLSVQAAWRLVGNSMDVRCVDFCLEALLASSKSKK